MAFSDWNIFTLCWSVSLFGSNCWLGNIGKDDDIGDDGNNMMVMMKMMMAMVIVMITVTLVMMTVMKNNDDGSDYDCNWMVMAMVM